MKDKLPTSSNPHGRNLLIGFSRYQSRWVLLLMLSLFGCEEEEVTQAPRRSVTRIQAKTQANGIDLTKYSTAGNGPKDAPDWIQSQDFSLMRRYSQDPLKGFRNGNVFEPQEVIFERRERGWFLVLNEVSLKYPNQLYFEGERIEIPLPDEPTDQLREKRGGKESAAVWRLPASQTRGQTRLWEAESNYSLELLEWDVTPYKKNGDVFQVTGKASGRIMAYFVDAAGAQGWMVGRFENAKVRFLGDPSQW